MASAKTEWNDQMGPRGRAAWAVLVTADGSVHRFTGTSVLEVCHATVVAHQKNGKWSNTTFSVTHKDTTTLVGWYEDFGTGRVFPQESWESALQWIQAAAPSATAEGFECFCREHCPSHSQRWDEQRSAEMLFA